MANSNLFGRKKSAPKLLVEGYHLDKLCRRAASNKELPVLPMLRYVRPCFFSCVEFQIGVRHSDVSVSSPKIYPFLMLQQQGVKDRIMPRVAISSSRMPSTKYSWPGSPERFSSVRTASDRMWGGEVRLRSRMPAKWKAMTAPTSKSKVAAAITFHEGSAKIELRPRGPKQVILLTESGSRLAED